MKLSLSKKILLGMLSIYSLCLIAASFPWLFTPRSLVPVKRALVQFFSNTLGTPPGIPVFSFGKKMPETYAKSFCAVNFGITADSEVIEDRLGYTRRCPRPDEFFTIAEDHRAIFFYHISVAMLHPLNQGMRFQFLRLQSTKKNFPRQSLQAIAFLSCRSRPDFTSVITGVLQTSWNIQENKDLRQWVHLAKWSCHDLSLMQIEWAPRAENDPHLRELWPEILRH